MSNRLLPPAFLIAAVILIVGMAGIVSSVHPAPQGAMVSAIQPKLTGPTTVSYNSSVDNFSLSYLEYLPDGFNQNGTYPAAVFLHGAGTSTGWVTGGVGASSISTGLIVAAKKASFLLMSINTRSSSGFYQNTPCGGPQQQDVLDAIAREQSLRHVGSLYLIGFSMGSVGALTLVAEHPGMFAGLAVAGVISDAFEVQAFNYARHDTNPGWAADQCGAKLIGNSSVAIGFAYHVSPLRFYPQNFSGVKLYMVGGGQDVRAPNNFSKWPYANVNSTVRNSTCAVSIYGEPANCTTTIGALHNKSPGLYPYLDVYEPDGIHSVAEFYPVSVFAFFTGTQAGGLYHAAFPPTKLLPGP